MYTLINDLESRGLLDSTLVLMMGEFGRSPVMTNIAGRGHWTNVMSMLVAGGGLPSGQVIGAPTTRATTSRKAASRPPTSPPPSSSIWASRSTPSGSIRRADRSPSSPKAAGPFPS